MKARTTEDIATIISAVLSNRHVQDKINISATHEKIGAEASLPVQFQKDNPKIKKNIALGDDCAAIPDGHGAHMLFASEGIIKEFLEADPWFAGYSAVMVNISDVLSMGGIPIAVTDVLWGKNNESLEEVWQGMLAASQAYDVPIVGGHTCLQTDTNALSVSILGKANRLLSSFDALPGQHLIMAIDLKGAYYKHYTFWNASTTSEAQYLQQCGKLLKTIADNGLSSCAKDISMGGVLGTIAMLGTTSGVGFDIDFEQLPPPPDGDWVRWLTSFPSYGYILTCEEKNLSSLLNIFRENEIFASSIGLVKEKRGIQIIKEEKTFKFI